MRASWKHRLVGCVALTVMIATCHTIEATSPVVDLVRFSSIQVGQADSPVVVNRREAGKWLAYARLVALVSSEPRWQALAQEHFDPTARRFVAELGQLYPQAEMAAVAECFIYAISAMLALLTSRWRIAALSDGQEGGDIDGLIAFCAAGVAARLSL